MSWRRTLRAALLVGIGLLYALSIPWYRDPAEAPEIWLGMPDWVAVAVLCYLAIACCNALAWLLTDVRDDEGEGGS